MSNPTRRYTTEIDDLERDSSGLLWLIHQHVSNTGRAADWRSELLTRALFSLGGVILPGTLDLTSGVVTVTGPHLGITLDGLTPVVLDPLGEDETLALSAFNAYADGTHTVVVRASPVTEGVNFTSPQRVLRDTAGNVIETISPENLTHDMVASLGVLTLVSGSTLSDGDVPVATVDKSGSSWSNLQPILTEPSPRFGRTVVEDADPTVDDDITEGFYLGSLWLQSLTGDLWVCMDPAAGAAVWGSLQRSANMRVPVQVEAGTSKNLSGLDIGYFLRFTSGSAVTATLLTVTLGGFPVGARFQVCQAGAGAVTVSGASGVTINGAGSVATSAQYEVLEFIMIDDDEWIAR